MTFSHLDFKNTAAVHQFEPQKRDMFKADDLYVYIRI